MLFLNTKLHIPAPRAGLVPRPRLLSRLERVGAHKLSLVSAPAGFGKTTLLTTWLTAQLQDRAGAHKIAWLALDEGDNDLTRFWLYVCGALNSAADGVADEALALLETPHQPPIETALTVLLNALAVRAEPFFLVLDDYHFIQTRAIHDALEFFLNHLAPNVHVILTARSDPSLSLTQLRARGQLLELRAGDLRFNDDEARAFLNGVMRLDLSSENVMALEARTEGWIAGLQLAALSMQGLADVSDFITTFTGSHRYIIEYLVEQVLAQQSETTQQFLLETSILGRLNADLCDALVERADSALVLEQLERANLFLISLDDAQEWFRYHHLFADVLRYRLIKYHGARVPELHRRASEWHEHHGLTGEAIQHALEARDFERAARLIAQYAEAMDNRGEHMTVKNWLDALPDAVVQTDAQLSYLRAHKLIVTHRLEQAESFLDAVERALDAQRTDLSDAEMHLRYGVENQRIFISLIRGDLPRTIALAENALAQFPPDEHKLRGEITMRLAAAYFFDGQLERAYETFEAARLLSERAGDINGILVLESFQAEILLGLGRLGAAQALYNRLVQTAKVHAMLDAAARYAYGDLGELLYEWNRLPEANTHLMQAVVQSERMHNPRVIAWSLVPLAYCFRAQEDWANADKSYERAQELVRDHQLPPEHAARAAALGVRLMLARRQTGAASEWARTHEFAPQDKFDLRREPEYFALVRVRLAEGQYDRAMELASRLEVTARSQERIPAVIRALVLQVLIYRARGKTAHTRAILARALALAEPEGYVRTFADEGAAMQAELSGLKLEIGVSANAAGNPRLPAYIEKLLAAFPGQDQNPRHASNAALLPEPLTERELDILRLIAQGHSNAAIADTLGLAVGTVKKYTNNIFGKLQVASRTQAVLRARELELV